MCTVPPTAAAAAETIDSPGVKQAELPQPGDSKGREEEEEELPAGARVDGRSSTNQKCKLSKYAICFFFTWLAYADE